MLMHRTVCLFKPKFHYADFHQNFPAGKVVDTNHLDMSRCLRQSPWQVCDEPVCVALMEFSPLQCTRKVGDKVRDTQIKKVRDANHESRRHDLCRGLSWFVSATFPAGKFW